MLGGVCINTGTIPSKTLREAVLYLTGMAQRDLYGAAYRVKDEITIGDLSARTQHVIGREIEVIRNQLTRNHVTLITGDASLRRPAHDRLDGVDRPARSARRRHRACARHPAGPARPGRVRRSERGRLGRHPQPAAGARHDGRGGRRRDRHRVRVDVRGARHPGDGRRRSARRCSTSATPRSSSRCSTTCATSRHVPLRRNSREGRKAALGAPSRRSSRKAHSRRDGDVLRRPAGCHRRAVAGERGAGGRPARPDHVDDHFRTTPVAHLRGRRRDRLSRRWPPRRWSRVGWRPCMRG